MKLIHPCTIACLSLLLLNAACTRPSANAAGYSAGPDETKGMTSSRKWGIHSVGYAKGDSMRPSDSVIIEWPRKFDRKVDTMLAASWINNSTISFATVQMQFHTDDGTKRLFDTVSQGTVLRTSLTYSDVDSSMVYIYHSISGQNPATGIYYTTDDTFKTK